MAKEKKEKTPGYEEFHDALQSGAVGNVYIFHGEETYLMQQAVAELQARLVPAGFEEFNYHRLAGKGLTMQEVVEAAEAMPMMAERTLVTVEDGPVQAGRGPAGSAGGVAGGLPGVLHAGVFVPADTL